MNSLKKTTICLLFLCIGVNCVFSEVPEQINFSYISINEGLSQSTVFSIDQDQRGNMWFATYDGVNKYDGYSFTVYQHNEEDPNSIANDISRIVKTDSQGRVWIGTRDGLSYYDEEKDKFRNFFYEKKGKRQQINGIAEISPEQLLISTQEGLTMFDIKESKFVDDSFSTAMHKLIASALYRQGQNIGRIIPKIAYIVNISPVKKAALNCPIMKRMNNLHKKRKRKSFPLRCWLLS